MKVKRRCLFCGKEFYVIPSRIKRGSGKFCSKKCYYQSIKGIKKIGDKNPNWRGGKIKKLCETCGIEFYCRINQHSKYCSIKCRNQGMKGSIRTKRIKMICKQCGKIFYLTPSMVKKRRGGFCSTKCFGQWKTKNNRGENNPNWKNGKSFEPYTPEFNNILKEQIRARDKNICQLCGKTKKENGEKLSIHHIDYNKENCKKENLTTLCRGCNSKVNANRIFWTGFFMGRMYERMKQLDLF